MMIIKKIIRSLLMLSALSRCAEYSSSSDLEINIKIPRFRESSVHSESESNLIIYYSNLKKILADTFNLMASKGCQSHEFTEIIACEILKFNKGMTHNRLDKFKILQRIDDLNATLSELSVFSFISLYDDKLLESLYFISNFYGIAVKSGVLPKSESHLFASLGNMLVYEMDHIIARSLVLKIDADALNKAKDLRNKVISFLKDIANTCYKIDQQVKELQKSSKSPPTIFGTIFRRMGFLPFFKRTLHHL